MKGFLIIALFFIQINLGAQMNNIIQNPGFEYPINLATPFYYGLIDNNNDEKRDVEAVTNLLTCEKITVASNQICLESWRSDVNFDKKEGLFGSGCLWGDLHSPDWFKLSQTTLTCFEPFPFPNGPITIIQPHSGNSYVGMGPGELIQQKFANNNKFIEGETYTLSMYIRTTGNWSNGVTSDADWSNPSVCNLKCYLKKNDDKYSVAAQKIQNKCLPLYNDKATTVATRINILDIYVDLINYPTGQWYVVTANFIAPEDSFDWVVFETTETPLNCDTYVLLDDITLSKTCEIDDCDRLSGLVQPQHNGAFGGSTPLILSNLENVSDITLKYYVLNGSAAFYQESHHCENGIRHDIYWDGKTQNGSHVANGSYLLKMEALNACGVSELSTIIVKSQNYTGILPSYPACNNSGVIVPEQCCSLQPDIYLDFITLPGLGLLDYVAQNNIYSGTLGPVQITSNAEVVYQAGNSIIIGPNTTINFGADFHAFISPCIDGLRLMQTITNSDSCVTPCFNSNSNIDNLRNDQKLENNPYELKLANLENNIYEIQSINSTIKNIEVYSLNGSKILSFALFENVAKIDLQKFVSGIYIVRAISDKEVKMFKIQK